MRTCASIEVAASQFGRLYFTGLEPGRRVDGLHVWSASTNAADVIANLDARVFAHEPKDGGTSAATGSEFTQGEPLIQREVVSGRPIAYIAIGRYFYLPLDLIADRFSCIGVEFEASTNGDHVFTVGVELGPIEGVPGSLGDQKV